MRKTFATVAFAALAFWLSASTGTLPDAGAQPQVACDGSYAMKVKCPIPVDKDAYIESPSCALAPAADGTCTTAVAFSVSYFNCYPAGTFVEVNDTGMSQYLNVCTQSSLSQCFIQRTCDVANIVFADGTMKKTCTMTRADIAYSYLKQDVHGPSCAAINASESVPN